MLYRNSSTIRFQLTCLVIACVLPVWVLAVFLVSHAYSSKRDQINRNMLETARSMTMAVDRELTGVQAALVALATSPSFDKRDFEGVHRQSLELLKAFPGADIIVADRTGQQLVNSFRPFGTPLPKRSNPELVEGIFASGKPSISNLFYGAVTKRPLIAIDVPVLRGGKVVYDLSMTFSSDRMAALLALHNLPRQWYGSILDGRRVIVARTRKPEQFVGKRATPEFIQALAAAPEGTSEVRNVEGLPVLAAFCKSSLSGWAVTFAVPRAVVMTEIYHWMGWAIGGATTISLIGIFLAMGIAGRIARAIQSLVHPALAMGRGELVTTFGQQTVRETAEVADALIQASELLQQRARERDRAEQQLSSTIDDLQRETAERLRAMAELYEKDRLLIQQSRQAAMGEMIGNIAHQWRQPLNALGLVVQQTALFFEHDKADKEFLEKNVAHAMELIQHMSQTIDDFRNFFRPDKEKVEFRVREEVAKTLSLMEESLNSRQIGIEVVVRDEPVIYGYPNEFSQVLLNILINARDALAERQIATPKVEITIGTEGERAVVTIADNAGGIPEEIINKVFDPYFTTKGPQGGTGVGLFMSKSIIEKNMGGLLSVRNIADGAEFRIEV
jgi:signal transduction histidine kinase